MQGCTPSADSVAGIAGSQTPALFTKQSWQKAKNPRGSGTESPFYWGDKIPEQLEGHYR